MILAPAHGVNKSAKAFDLSSLDGPGTTLLMVGRSANSQIRLQGATLSQHLMVSRKHAMIVRRAGLYFLVDLRSANGTFVARKTDQQLHQLQPSEHSWAVQGSVHHLSLVFE